MYLVPPDPRRIADRLAEQLWGRLRLGQLSGYRFQRRCPVGQLVADFYCAEAGLVVQLESARAADRGRNARAEQFERGGYTVVRISEYELIDNIDRALRKIAMTLEAVPSATRPHLRYIH